MQFTPTTYFAIFAITSLIATMLLRPTLAKRLAKLLRVARK